MFTNNAVRDDLLSYGRFRRVIHKIDSGDEVSLDLVLSALDKFRQILILRSLIKSKKCSQENLET